ncbi:hypothetical protein BWGOE4_35370 [Bacillus mycoides]|uniref:MgtC/SapB family protein n=1 Tax=Bacillus mycoides TaxID=1405 RepID=A0A1D3MQ98_BACMY|nr:hypothetical protein IEM_01039 [Bacillus cereus BAG6O-2]OFD39094.1 hypothetical protein BWGOE2_34960 [Bacillus mycoides]OFD43888.1 hypothetical protein BWGOE1_34820 [Bacillus mycoides]OFD55227.1 hypothetical protein BWGOE4_35370 [Bacillus mycoides]OFD89895.1 hypothetical protein BWGOE11_36080 [Bacillus mycoides]
MSLHIYLIIRIGVAGLLGAMIGIEREIRLTGKRVIYKVGIQLKNISAKEKIPSFNICNRYRQLRL